MSRYYRRYHRRRRSGGVDGFVGLIVVFAVIVYAFGKIISLTMNVVVVIIGAVLLTKLLKALWRRWHKGQPGATTTHPVVTPAPASNVATMTPFAFERYVAGRLKDRGYSDIKMTERYDWGVDIIARKDSVTWGVQVKHSSGMVKAAAVRQVVTALKKYNCDRAMVVTNGFYSRPALPPYRTPDSVGWCNGRPDHPTLQ